MDKGRFRSPVSKLVKFFEQSRNRWKAKYQEAKHRNKLLANQARAVERSRDLWKARARDAQRRLRQLERELSDLKCTAQS